MNPLIRDKKTGMLHREGTYDLGVIREAWRCYTLLDVTGEVVFDVGGNIGTFAVKSAAKAKSVDTYEPDAQNFDVLVQNCKDLPNVFCHNSALVPGNEKQISFFISTGSNKGCHTMIPTKGRTEIVVPAQNFQAEINRVMPTVLKMDCEGAEFSLIPDLVFPKSLKQIAMEIHLTKKVWKESAKQLTEKILQNGFVAVKEPILNRAWHTIGIWKRS